MQQDCKHDSPFVIVKTKRGDVRCYCPVCFAYIRKANKDDLAELRKVRKG